MIQNPHIMSVAIFFRTPPPSGRFLFSAERRSLPSSQALVRKEKREAREGRRKREAWGVHCTPPPPSPGLRGPQACMDGRKGDRWTLKPSSVQPGYTLVDTLWVRLGGRGQYLQASWLVVSRHLSCMLDFVWYLLAGKEGRGVCRYVTQRAMFFTVFLQAVSFTSNALDAHVPTPRSLSSPVSPRKSKRKGPPVSIKDSTRKEPQLRSGSQNGRDLFILNTQHLTLNTQQ